MGRGLALLALAWLTFSPALAQVPGGGGVSQSGAVTNGDCAKWVGNSLIADSGSGCGGSGSPGGTAGQVQYNSSGSFGGFTVSGDVTLPVSVGGHLHPWLHRPCGEASLVQGWQSAPYQFDRT